jgi:hypothetical protein
MLMLCCNCDLTLQDFSFILIFIFSFSPKIRMSGNITDDVDEDPTGNKALWDRGLLNGASQKAGIVANFHVGEICMSLQVNLAVTLYFHYFLFPGTC